MFFALLNASFDAVKALLIQFLHINTDLMLKAGQKFRAANEPQ
jgi:hypothetical protein